MKNTSKPQWLIDAENEIKKFEETKYGKMSDKEFRFLERQTNAGKAGGKVSVESGHWDSLKTVEHQTNAGKAGGNALVESGKLIINLQKANIVNKSKIECIHCKKSGTLINIKQHHNDNCKLKADVMIPVLNALPVEFKKPDLVKELEKYNIGPQWQCLVDNPYWIVKFKKKGTKWIYTKGQGYTQS